MGDVEWEPDMKVPKPKQAIKKEKKPKKSARPAVSVSLGKHKKEKKSAGPVISIVPRLQLEPRLTQTSPTKANYQVSDKERVCSDSQISDIKNDKKPVVVLDSRAVKEYFERQQASLLENKDTFTIEEALSFVNPVTENKSRVPSSSSPEDFDNTFLDFENFSAQNKAGKKNASKIQRKPHKRKGVSWKDSELKYLAHGLQAHGFAELDKVAAFMKTKNENEIREYMKPLTAAARNNRDAGCQSDSSQKNAGRPPNSWKTVSHENLKNWPNVRKWRRFAYEQMLPYTRTKDYSKPVIQALCKKFYEEEEEPSDPQVINVKLIYKYLMDCTSGKIPPQLPPKESALVLDMLRDTRLMPIAYDFEEERNFLQTYKTSTKFKPFEVKDEFKKRFKKAIDSDDVTPDTVPVPEPVFVNLSRHKRLVQSFNPLVIPVWMAQKEQEHLEQYHNDNESNVYVD